MKLTARQLTTRENAIFNALEQTPGDTTFRKRQYRDGVPTPQVYLAQRPRVLFVASTGLVAVIIGASDSIPPLLFGAAAHRIGLWAAG